MNEERKAWCKRNKVNIPQGGFRDKFCTSEHVGYVLPIRPGEKAYFIGFDGKAKSYEQLTPEEKQDFKEQQSKITENLHRFVNRSIDDEDIERELGE